MRYLSLDFETYFDQDYSLKKLSPLEYIRDERFHVHGCAIKWRGEPALWLEGEEFRRFTEATDWTQVTLIGHNLNFDLVVLYEHYGISPAHRVDTLGLCRALLPRDIDFDLDSVAKLLGLPGKTGGGEALQAVKGVRHPDRAQLDALGEYARGDVENTEGLFEILYPHYPEREREAMDLVLKMSTEGVLHLDAELLEEAEQEILEDRRAKLEAVGTTPEALRSRDQFAELLRARGVEPPTKISPATNRRTYAFSRQDPEFVRLQADPRCADLVAARLAWASNNAISRVQRFKRIARLGSGTLPVQLQVSGAHTHRLSGGGGINSQNLNRGSKLRHSLIAPPGHVIVVADSSQIELRGNAWYSGQHDILELLRRGGDVYKREAANQFNIPEDQVDKDQRGFGKVLTLACGYGMGADKFRTTCAIGPMGNPPIYLSELEAHKAVQMYRAANPQIKANWDWLQEIALPVMADPKGKVERRCLTFTHETITLPGGLTLKYPDLHATEDGWVWGINGKTHRVYGGILAENLTQALAGEIIRYQMLDIAKELEGIGRVVHQVHDEILVVCLERDADDVLAVMQRIMGTSPEWAPDLPLSSEGGYDFRYSK